ncbi:FUSC family protein [Winogradskyella litoriviva]|uniref:FUSC family protein n=1 Tax=Winogradskyella litoriviva TaxID=1220182 RepID=A0ABX2E1M7_9FLAO|nr:FUSC family protein [Winogradskyella litoriviva]
MDLISKHAKELLEFFKSTSFSKAVLVSFAVTTPIILGIATNHLEIGLALCFGAIWCSPSDVSGRLKHKQIGILYSSLLVVIVSFIGGYLKDLNYFLFPILGLLTFSIAFISIYGFRASLISFSGLLALVLSFANTTNTLENYTYALLIGLGGIWYLLLSTLWFYINPKAQTEEAIIKTILLTADFIDIRKQIIGEQANRQNLQTSLINLQSELAEQHVSLREILLLSRRSSGKSNYKNRRLMVFSQLVEILETANANPVNYDKMDVFFEMHPETKKKFQNLIAELSYQLRTIAKNLNQTNEFSSNKILSDAFNSLEKDILEFKNENNFEEYERYLMLQNFLDYQKKQFEKLKKIKWLLGNPELSTEDYHDNNKLKRFIEIRDYNPKIILRNFSFRSTIFKHSLRLSVAVMLGYAIGLLFDFQNPYWIILTIIIIMRPSYGLTKTRSKDRMIGTLIGAVLATCSVFIINDPYIFGALGVLSLVIAFSMVQKNYKASATFITLSVILIYAILEPNIFQVIQFRVIDTLIGAAISYSTMRLIWPAWSIAEISDNIKDSLQANITFFKSISNFYQKKGEVPTSLKINRKEAFLQMSNLSSAFQRMAQEPESKQKHIDEIYELVVLNHSCLTSLASLSTYTQNNKTSKASKDFILIAEHIIKNLEKACAMIKDVNFNDSEINKSIFIPEPYDFPKNLITSDSILKSDNELTHKEAHLVWEQLYWLHSLSEKMLKLTFKFSR